MRGFLGRTREVFLPKGYPFFQRLMILLPLLGLYFGGYFGLGQFNLHRRYYYDVSLRIDSMIPFIPELIYPYLLVIALVAILYVAAPDLPTLKKAAKAILALALIHFVFFALVPVKAMHRPMVVADGTWTKEILLFFYWLDAPVNLFPSMHIGMSFLVAWICGSFNRTLGIICRILASAVLVSVLCVKQHYVADVMAGLVVGYFSYWFAFVYERQPQPDWVPIVLEALRRYSPRWPKR
ncbi:MAG: phosphatase PAP2 family protein [Nitrospirae bacterium]|nr:phosphatase PAP2 family protein [Nitrospirota bacterium]